MAHKIAYARVSTADQNPDLQLDALAAEGYLKIYTDTATGTKSDRPQWNECLKDLRPGDTLIVWKIDRLGRNLHDLIDIVTTLQTRGVGVRSLPPRAENHHYELGRRDDDSYTHLSDDDQDRGHCQDDQ